MDDIKKDITKIRESQVRTEVDIKHHIKRTDLLEAKVLPLHKAFIGIKWSIAFIITLSILVSALSKLGLVSLQF